MGEGTVIGIVFRCEGFDLAPGVNNSFVYDIYKVDFKITVKEWKNKLCLSTNRWYRVHCVCIIYKQIALCILKEYSK